VLTKNSASTTSGMSPVAAPGASSDIASHHRVIGPLDVPARERSGDPPEKTILAVEPAHSSPPSRSVLTGDVQSVLWTGQTNAVERSDHWISEPHR
jgi:hypothetical protein